MSKVLPVYAIHTDMVRQMNWASLHQSMPERMKKAYRYYFERDRLLCVGAALLMRQVAGVRDEAELRTGPFGKLSAPGYPAFNLSHSGDWCVLVKGDQDIGVDIEKDDEKNLCVASTVYTPAEIDWMNEDPFDRFYTLWTLKESLMKATGLGFQLEPPGFEVLPFLQGRPVIQQEKEWFAATGKIPGYHFSVCTRTPIEELEWIEYS